MTDAVAAARGCFLRACELDVAVRKPGNVSLASPGHGMHAGLFLASARAAAGPLFRPGASVGERIEAAVAASWGAAGCNTNLGILLLCAPIARAVECSAGPLTREGLRSAIGNVLQGLDVADACGAYRAIALANPGGLGAAPAQDVRAAPPSVDLRAAMALAAGHDLIARQYHDGFAEVFDVGVAALPSVFSPGLPEREAAPDAATTAAVQRVYLALLSTLPDSHIVRKHGEAVAHNVMSAAQPFCALAARGDALDADAAFMAWDAALKAHGVNPGTTADLTVAALLIASLVARAANAR